MIVCSNFYSLADHGAGPSLVGSSWRRRAVVPLASLNAPANTSIVDRFSKLDKSKTDFATDHGTVNTSHYFLSVERQVGLIRISTVIVVNGKCAHLRMRRSMAFFLWRLLLNKFYAHTHGNLKNISVSVVV